MFKVGIRRSNNKNQKSKEKIKRTMINPDSRLKKIENNSLRVKIIRTMKLTQNKLRH